MTRLVRVPLPGLASGECVLEPAAARYVARVHRLGRGDRFVVFDPEHVVEAEAEIIESSRTGVRCRIASPRRSEAVPHFELTLLHALGKADKPERVVRDATALGARRIVFVESARAVVRLSAGSARRARWHKVALEAARQSQRADVPEVAGPLALHSALAEHAGQRALRLLLDPASNVSLGSRLDEWAAAQPVTVLIGPEGGFEPREEAAAVEAGFEPVSLGRFVLRTETAVTACLGAIVSRT